MCSTSMDLKIVKEIINFKTNNLFLEWAKKTQRLTIKRRASNFVLNGKYEPHVSCKLRYFMLKDVSL